VLLSPSEVDEQKRKRQEEWRKQCRRGDAVRPGTNGWEASLGDGAGFLPRQI